MHPMLPRGVRPRLEGKQRIPLSSRVAMRIRDPRCSPRGNPAYRGTFWGRMKAVRFRFALQGGTGDFLETPSRARASSCEKVGPTWFFSTCGGILL